MSQRTFWIIVVKIFGIFLVVESIIVIPQSIISLAYLGYSEQEGSIVLLAGGIIIMLIFMLIVKIFVNNPGWLIDKLKLDQGLPDISDDFKINKGSVISAASIILGGVLFVDGLPLFIKQLFVFYQEESLSGRFGDKPSTQWLILNAIKTFAGYLIVTNHVLFSKFVDKQSGAE